MSERESRRCHTSEDVKVHSGERGAVVGIYHAIDIRMRPKNPKRLAGHAAIQLDDGTDVLLEPSWSQGAIRSEDERERFEGKRVEATGVIHAESPEPPEPVAFITGPCLSPVDQIEAASES